MRQARKKKHPAISQVPGPLASGPATTMPVSRMAAPAQPCQTRAANASCKIGQVTPKTNQSSSPTGPSSGARPSSNSAIPPRSAASYGGRLNDPLACSQPPSRDAAIASPATAKVEPCWLCSTTARGTNTSRQPITKSGIAPDSRSIVCCEVRPPEAGCIRSAPGQRRCDPAGQAGIHPDGRVDLHRLGADGQVGQGVLQAVHAAAGHQGHAHPAG